MSTCFALLGYTEGMKLSKEVFVKEGQKLELRFRGNIQPDEDVGMLLPFNSHLKTQISLYVTEIDKYAQKSFSSYRGFAQFYIEGLWQIVYAELFVIVNYVIIAVTFTLMK